MDRRNGDVGDVAGAPTPSGEALEFVRFCHRRKHVGWPELYDEMCAVAGRGLYLGYGAEELGELGIGFGLFEMPALAILVGKVVAEDMDRRRRVAEAVKATVVMTSKAHEQIGLGDGAETAAGAETTRVEIAAHDGRTDPAPAERAAPEHGSIRIALAGA